MQFMKEDEVELTLSMNDEQLKEFEVRRAGERAVGCIACTHTRLGRASCRAT